MIRVTTVHGLDTDLVDSTIFDTVNLKVRRVGEEWQRRQRDRRNVGIIYCVTFTYAHMHTHTRKKRASVTVTSLGHQPATT